jgi:hypothetical protein
MLLTVEAAPFAMCIKKIYEVFDHLKDRFSVSYIAKNKKTIFRLQWAVTVEWKIGSWTMGEIQK